MRSLLRILLAVAGVLGAVGLLLHFAQRRLLYFPEREDRDEAVREARRLGLEPWLAADGRLLGWKAPHPSGQPTGRVLVLHGNAGSAAHRIYLRDVFQAAGLPRAFDVYLLEYPGYGPRPGSPSEPSLLAAGREAVDLLAQDAVGPLFLAGESLGSAVAALVAAERRQQVTGLVLVTPLLSVPAVARRHFPFVPSLLIRDTFRADLALPRYGGPVAFLVAAHDSVVFPDLGETLFTSYPGPKRLWRDERADHNTIDFSPRSTLWHEMMAFLVATTPAR